ncbi:Detected protein of unknown function [Hibiscus syriacus]|uniref:Uncharacterized protein n=1 Tax=Hibiscus syriacus TaxID=106335 RepID=A0A6A2XU95_HIBSY|nr:Detected protein of unknown function [Hibiscus syriacus]
MGSFTLEEISGFSEELVKKACLVSMAAHKSPDKPFLVEYSRTSSDVFFSFPGSWSAAHWFTRQPFGEIKVDQSDLLCPKGNDEVATSLRSIGRDELETVNEGFLRRFEWILATSSLPSEVEKAILEKKKIVFTGHSSDDAVAILATVWFLAQYLYDIVPRILLAPLSSMGQELEQILCLLNQKAVFPIQGSMVEASKFYEMVMRNASAVASHAACRLMGNTNPILETVASFIELSPYRPCGTFLCSDNEHKSIAERSLNNHFNYPSELQESLNKPLVQLDHLEAIPLSKRREHEKQKLSNQQRMDNKDTVSELQALEEYELPEGFENRNKWIKLATKYCRIVEPLDIANYYWHARDEDTGPYMYKGRPRRYRYTQRWREHACGIECRILFIGRGRGAL